MKSNLNEFLKKYVNNKSVYIIIIIGIVFMFLPELGTQRKSDKKAPSYGAYSDEERLCGILSRIDGAGEVSVMITYYGTSSYDVAFEQKQNTASSDKETAQSTENSVILSDGTPLVKGEVYPKAKGVVIVAEGAGGIQVRKAITDAACAALDIAPYRVCVLEGKERN